MGCFSAPSSSSTTETKTEEQKAGIKKALATYLPTLGKGADIFPGERVTPFSALQEEAITGAGRFADYFAEPETAGTPLFNETGQAITGLLEGRTGAKAISPKETEQYFGRAVKEPTMKQFKEETIPGIAESFAGPGFWGGGRSQEQAEAYQDIGDWLGEKRAGLEWDVNMFNRGLAETKAGRTQAAVPQAMAYGKVPREEIMGNLEIAATKIGGLASIFGIGQAEQTQQQMELQDEILRFAEENQITAEEDLQIILTLLGMNFSRSAGSSSGAGLGYAGASSALQTFGQMAGTAAGSFMGF